MSQLSILARMATLAAHGLSEQGLSSHAVACVAEALGADMAALYLSHGRAGGAIEWTLSASNGESAELLARLPFEPTLAPVFESGSDVLLDDTAPSAPASLRSAVGTPIRGSDGVQFGAIVAGAGRASAFGPANLSDLVELAHLAGVGLENARGSAARQREEPQSAESAPTLGAVLESVSSGVCVVDLHCRLRHANQALREMFGLSAVSGTPLVDAFASATKLPRDREVFLARLRQLGDGMSETDNSEWLLATDPPRSIQRRSAPMRNVLGEVVGRVDVYTDVTDLRRLFTQLLSSERSRAVGEMASGIAHDLNNVLASIVGQTDLLQVENVPAPARQAIATIREAALGGARMLRNLQARGRPRSDAASGITDLNATVQQAVDMARARCAATALHGRGTLDVSLALADDDLRPVAIDAGELQEVLVNLLVNASDAMPSGGRIEVATRPARSPGSAEVSVRDTGEGIPEPLRGRLFEPFFSTRGGHRNGLGLALAYSTISRAGGEIRVESEVGSGSTFTVRIPFVSAAPSPAPAPAPPRVVDAAPTPTSTSPAGQSLKGARILIADDEPSLLTIVRQLMERSGAQVTVANGGAAALDAIRDPRKHFDAVITDLDMPEVDGWAVTTEVKLRAPQTAVVMLTGWAGEIAPEDFKARGVDVVLAKPCSRAELESAMARVLAERQTPRSGLDVLLVDDEPAFGRSIRDLLSMQGHRVTLVDSAPAGLQALEAQAYDVVLTDYSLGETNGAQLAEQIAQRGSRPYVVLITGYAVEIDDPSLMTAGVDAVLPKPARAKDLRAVLSRVPPRAS